MSGIFDELEQQARAEVSLEGVDEERIRRGRRLWELRYLGQGATLMIDEQTEPAVAFEREHRRRYGHAFEGRPVEVVSLRVEVIGDTEGVSLPRLAEHVGDAEAFDSQDIWIDGDRRPVPVFERDGLGAGVEIEGPALVVEATGTTLVEVGWRFRVLAGGELELTALSRPETGAGSGARRAASAALEEASRQPPRRAKQSAEPDADPIELELFNHRYSAVAEDMGANLRRTALSVNVKERLDFSCALFTSRGRLVANAPHMPVHLGAMSETVSCVLEDLPDLRPGDVVLTNDPFRGGSHLPDLTVVTPVFHPQQGTLLAFVASRAHHADIGETRPGSMPPDSRRLEEEGVLIRAFKVVEEGREDFARLREILAGGRYPARNVEENVADVSAQIAANHTGVEALLGLMDEHGDAIWRFMDHVQGAAAAKVRQSLEALGEGEWSFEDQMDDGSAIALTLTLRAGRAIFDFSGSAQQVSSNLNANRAIVKAAVLYSLRCLIDEDIPLNDGVLEPVELVIPAGILDPPGAEDPADCPAVVGGNVETSQRITDVVLGALGLAAASQGTMNNFTFGSASFGYYETICGGAGAGPGFAGTSAVHTHMTNTRLTDPEVLEARYPVVLRRFEIRAGSGGRGRWSGGDGVVREVEFREPMEVSLLTQRRTTRPFGMKGGDAGKPGVNAKRRRDGTLKPLPGVCSLTVEPGECIRIETPGGGGWGSEDA